MERPPRVTLKVVQPPSWGSVPGGRISVRRPVKMSRGMSAPRLSKRIRRLSGSQRWTKTSWRPDSSEEYAVAAAMRSYRAWRSSRLRRRPPRWKPRSSSSSAGRRADSYRSSSSTVSSSWEATNPLTEMLPLAATSFAFLKVSRSRETVRFCSRHLRWPTKNTCSTYEAAAQLGAFFEGFPRNDSQFQT